MEACTKQFSLLKSQSYNGYRLFLVKKKKKHSKEYFVLIWEGVGYIVLLLK